MSGSRLKVFAPDGLPEIGAGDDLAALVVDHVDLLEGDVVAVTSKVVAKAEGRVRAGDRDDAVAGETADFDDLAAALGQVPGVRTVVPGSPGGRVDAEGPGAGTAVAAICFAFGWQVDAVDDTTSGIAVLMSPVTT